jgi:pseudaminic acid cytidylyltransferase
MVLISFVLCQELWRNKLLMNIAIIPARKGSKRIKNKNIKLFNGKPIIAWSIIEAKKTKIFDEIIVTTDCEKIARISKKYGAKVPYFRNKSLSSDRATINEVMNSTVKQLKQHNPKIKFACLIYATAPFLMKKDLIKGFKAIKNNNNLEFVISISKFKSTFYRSLKVKDNKIFPLFKKYISTRTQDLSDLYFDNAQFTFGKVSSWIQKKHPYLSNTSYVYIPSDRVQDIDTKEDWKRAQILLKVLKN